MKLHKDTLDLYRHYAVLLEQVKDEFQMRLGREASSWLITAGLYPNDSAPKGAGFQLFRKGWFNDQGNGIHFETWMKKSYHEDGRVPFVLHVEVGKARAGFGQREFQSVFLERVGDRFAAQGYELNRGYAMEPVKRIREFQPDTYVPLLIEEFWLLSRYGDEIDKIIAELRTDE